MRGRKRRLIHRPSLFGFSKMMMTLLKNNRGATIVEFAIVALPVFVLIFGMMQVGYVLWIDNLLHVSVNAAARCGAVNSSTSPCAGSGSTNMITTAKTVFLPMSGATFNNNASCTANGGAGLVGTYSFVFPAYFLFHLTLTAQSCYPA
jgi:Flp pilus assembly protein TadG